MLTLQLDSTFSEATAHLDRLSKPVQQASLRALRKLLMFLQRQLVRQIAQQKGLPQGTLHRYRRVQIHLQGMDGTLWIGTNPLPLHEMGAVSWAPSDAGATVAGRLYAGSFYRAIYGTQRKVWIRTKRNQALGHAPYSPLMRHRQAPPGLAGRLPVTLLGMPLEDVQGALDARLAQQAQQRFRTLLQQELNHALAQAAR